MLVLNWPAYAEGRIVDVDTPVESGAVVVCRRGVFTKPGR